MGATRRHGGVAATLIVDDRVVGVMALLCPTPALRRRHLGAASVADHIGLGIEPTWSAEALRDHRRAYAVCAKRRASGSWT